MSEHIKSLITTTNVIKMDPLDILKLSVGIGATVGIAELINKVIINQFDNVNKSAKVDSHASNSKTNNLLDVLNLPDIGTLVEYTLLTSAVGLAGNIILMKLIK